jgi:hypothetical protein
MTTVEPNLFDHLTNELAVEFARQRCLGSGYMGDAHNPRPYEVSAARDFITYVIARALNVNANAEK